jgi:hypothetical protein
MAPIILDTGDTFRIRNDDKERNLDVALPGSKKAWHIAPGDTALVPFEVIRYYWGDPRCVEGRYQRYSDSGVPQGTKAWVNKREDEIERLGILYGSYSKSAADLIDPEYPMGHADWGTPKRVPHSISVQTERGERIIPLCFQTADTEAAGAIRDDSEDLTDQVAYREHLETQLDEIRAQLAQVMGQGASDAEVDTGRK